MGRLWKTGQGPLLAVLAIALLCEAGWALQTGLDEERSAELRALIDEQIAADTPGYAVGVVIDDEIVFTHYAGLALLDTPTPIDARTRFNIASVAKQYTALMVLDLAHAGRVSLSQDVRTYLPDALPGIEATITLEHLITHTSGIRDVYDLLFITNATWYETDFDNQAAMTLLAAQTGLNFTPGAEHQYSNSNYILLAELISAVTGEPFHAYATAFLHQRGMTDTSVRRRAGVVVPRLARAYADWGSGWLEFPDIANTQGDGFVFATLPDQLAWERQVWGHDVTLPEALIAQSQRPLEGVSYQGYGYGVEFGRYRGLETVFHEGATGSYNAYTVRFPGSKTSIVTMGNTGQVNAVNLAYQLAQIILADAFVDAPASYPAGPERLDAFTGIDEFVGLYQLDSGTRMRLVSREGALFREIEWREPVRMIYEQANMFRYETSPELKLVLTRSEQGVPELALYAPTQPPQFGVWIEPAPQTPDYAASVEGVFYNPETRTEIILEHVQGAEYTMIKNDRPRTLELIGRDYLVWNDYQIRVLRDETGRANGLNVDRNRARNVRFDRRD